MTNKSSSKTPLFLMELIIVILFFSICSAICMKIFASSQMLSKDASTLTGSVLACQSVAEVYKAENGDLEVISSLLDGEIDGNTVVVGYTNNWERTEYSDAPYYVSLVKEPGTTNAIVSAFQKSEESEIFLLKIRLVEVVQ